MPSPVTDSTGAAYRHSHINTIEIPNPWEPQSPTAKAAVTRALDTTNDWRPALDRRQSWNREEMKHAAHALHLPKHVPPTSADESSESSGGVAWRNSE